jgi:hypothetical protein
MPPLPPITVLPPCDLDVTWLLGALTVSPGQQPEKTTDKSSTTTPHTTPLMPTKKGESEPLPPVVVAVPDNVDEITFQINRSKKSCRTPARYVWERLRVWVFMFVCYSW